MSGSLSSKSRYAALLHDAAQYNNVHLIYEIAHSTTQPCADMNDLNEDGRTALHIAARSGHVEAVRGLLEICCDVNARDFNNDTALHIAASMGHTEVVRVLIEEGGADVTARGNGGNTPLHYAAEQRRIDTAELLMSINPPVVEAVNDDGLTPIELATWQGFDDVVRVLAVKWSGAYARALHIAAFEGNATIIRSLMRAEGSDVNARDQQGDTALHVAVDQGHIEAIRALTELGADVAAVNIDNETPLHVAFRSARFDAVSAAAYGHIETPMSERDKVVDDEHQIGQAPPVDVSNGRTESVAAPSKSTSTKNGNWASSEDHAEAVSVVLGDHGTDVSAVDNNGMTTRRSAFSYKAQPSR